MAAELIREVSAGNKSSSAHHVNLIIANTGVTHTCERPRSTEVLEVSFRYEQSILEDRKTMDEFAAHCKPLGTLASEDKRQPWIIESPSWFKTRLAQTIYYVTSRPCDDRKPPVEGSTMEVQSVC